MIKEKGKKFFIFVRMVGLEAVIFSNGMIGDRILLAETFESKNRL